MLKRQFLLGGLVAVSASLVGKGFSMAEDGKAVDIEALAALRPGMPASRVVEAMGSRWRTPFPQKGGVVDVLENSHGVVVRLDRRDRIGRITFDWRFKHAAVEGLRMGMPLAGARIAAPDIGIDERGRWKPHTGSDGALCRTASG